MKKVLSLILTVALLLTAVPLGLIEAAAASRIYLDTPVSVTTSAGDWDVRTFVPAEDGIYIFSSSGSYDTLGYIALAEGEAQNENIKDDGGQGENFAVTYEMTAGVTYYLGSTVLSGKGTYTVKIIKFEVDDDTIKPIGLSTPTSVTINASKGIRFYSFVPSASGKYVFYSSGNFDSMGYVFDEYWSQIAYADIGGFAQNFSITLDLQGGKTYYLGYSTTSVSNASFNILIYLETYISNVTTEKDPNKTTYIKGLDAIENGGGLYHVNLALTGFKFNINYSNGTTETKKYTYAIRGLDCASSRDLAAGENNVRYSYMSNYATFAVNVADSPVDSLYIVKQPSKSVYYEEDIETALDGTTKIFNVLLNGMIIGVRYTDGTSDTFAITSSYGEEIEYFYFDHIVKASDMQIGTNNFTITYYGKELDFDVKYSLNSDNWEYEIVNDSYVSLVKYIGQDNEAIIPDELGGYPVKAIGSQCFYENEELTSVRMTEKIVSIGSEAFYGCSSLTELTLPSTLTSVGEKAFFGLKKLEKLNWNAADLSYNSSANMFAYMGANASEGTTVEFGYTCTAVPENAFYLSLSNYRPNITKIIIGESVLRIGNAAFRDLPSLQKVEYNALLASKPDKGNNIWTNSGSPSFEVEVGEYVQKVPTYMFYATAARAPRISKFTVLGKNTSLEDNSVVTLSTVTCTYYVWYNPEQSTSAYSYCLNNSHPYELLDPKLQNIYIYSGSIKDEYMLGEEFNLNGAVIKAVFDDTSEIDVTSQISISGFDNTALGNQTVTVSYTNIGITKSFTVNIVMLAEPLVLDYIEITKQPDKTEYYAKENFSDEGIEVMAHFTNGFVQDVTNYVSLDGYDMTVLGVQQVTVSYIYEEITRTDTFSINVLMPVLTSISVSAGEENTSYILGGKLNKDGIKVIAQYINGDTADVTAFSEYSGYDMSVLGEQTVTVSYTDNGITKTDTFTINVHNKLVSISITALPTTRTFMLGSAFDPSGIEVAAFWENLTSTNISAEVSYSGYDMNTAGEQTLTVSYTKESITKTAQFTIKVVNKTPVSLGVSFSEQTVQYQNTPLNTDAITVTVTYSDSTSANVSDKAVITGYNPDSYGEQILYASYTEAGVTLRESFIVNVIRQELTKIEITDMPDKTVFEVGTAFSATGIKVLASYNNSLTKVLGANDLSFSGYNMALTGKQNVLVSYTENSKTVNTSYEIEVLNREVAVNITSLPAKTHYYIGQDLDLSGLVVSARMADDSTRPIYGKDLTFGNFDNQSEGTKTIYVYYTSPITEQSYTMSFEVVVESGLSGITITSPASTTVFYYGDEFDYSGLEVTAHFVDFTSKVVTDKCTLSGYNMSKLGRQSVTVTYSEGSESATASYNINVKDIATSIYVANMPSKLVYKLADNLSTSGLSVKARFASGADDRTVTSSVTNSGFESLTTGAKTVTLSYSTDRGVLTTSFDVTVKDDISAISIISQPEKTAYSKGENFDPYGMQAKVTLSNGQEMTVSASDLGISGFNPDKSGRQVLSVKYNYASNDLDAILKVTVDYDDSCDVNSDLIVDIADISEILASGNYSLSPALAQNAKADVNLDGSIDIFDINEILLADNYGNKIV